MAALTLAQEKVWLDKPAYDKAEQQYYERLAKSGTCVKGMPQKNTETFLSNKFINGNSIKVVNTASSGKLKSKKSKENKPLLDNGNEEFIRNSKCHKIKNSKKDNYSIQQDIKIEKEKNIELKQKEIILLNEHNIEKSEAKEIKEKKNKADKKHKNKEEKSEIKDEKEQLSQQGNHESTCAILPAGGSLANEVAKARQHIKESLQCMDDIVVLANGTSNQDATSRIINLEKENHDLKAVIHELKTLILDMNERVKEIEKKVENISLLNVAICPSKPSPTPEKEKDKDDDDDVDLFDSDSEGEDAEAAKIREQRLAAYAAKKSKKPVLIAKSNIILDIKPWDDETDMKEMESLVRKIECDGLLWGAAKLVPLAYGIHKLQISCVVEDDKVSIDWLTEQIQEIEDFVQSVDIAAFNKV